MKITAETNSETPILFKPNLQQQENTQLNPPKQQTGGGS